MSYSVSQLNELARTVQEDPDISIKAAIYASVKEDTDNFRNNIPPGCAEAIDAIKTIGLQAQLLMAAQERKRFSKEEDFREAPADSKREIEDEYNLTKRTIQFLSENSKQIKFGTSSVGLGILGALYSGIPYPVRVGAIGGGLAFLGAKYLLDRLSRDGEPDVLDKKEAHPPEALGSARRTSKKIKPTIHPTSSLLENQNPASSAIAVSALSALLLNKTKIVNAWVAQGKALYQEITEKLKLKKDESLDIEDIDSANLLHPGTILDPKILKPNNDLNILKSEDDLNKLLQDFITSSNGSPIGAIITRPPGTYAVFYNPDPKLRQFFFIDANNNETDKVQAQIFRSEKLLVKHLMDLRPIDKDSLALPKLYKTDDGIFQNPNACEIRILRKKDEPLKEKKTEKKEKGKIASPGKQERERVAKPAVSEEERLKRAEEEALQCALRLSTEGSPDSLPRFEKQEGEEPPADPSSAPYADELVARAMQEEEDRNHLSPSSGASPSITGDLLDEEALVQLAMEASLRE